MKKFEQDQNTLDDIIRNSINRREKEIDRINDKLNKNGVRLFLNFTKALKDGNAEEIVNIMKGLEEDLTILDNGLEEVRKSVNKKLKNPIYKAFVRMTVDPVEVLVERAKELVIEVKNDPKSFIEFYNEGTEKRRTEQA